MMFSVSKDTMGKTASKVVLILATALIVTIQMEHAHMVALQDFMVHIVPRIVQKAVMGMSVI